MKPTVEYILKSFHNSGKRHLLITGARGSGKTTRFLELAKSLADDLPGITTYAIPGECVMLRDNLTGEEQVIGRFNGVTMEAAEGLSALGVTAIERALQASDEWVGIDELGYLESAHEGFQRAVHQLFDAKRVMAVIRKQSTPFLNQIISRSDVFIVDLDDVRMKVGCVLMASGEARRFGANKLLAQLNEKMLMEYVLDTTEHMFERRVLVTRSVEVETICASRGIETILHQLPNRNDTVRLGTEYLAELDALVFCPCDQPMLRRETVLRLLDYPMLHDADILRLAWHNRPGTPILFGKHYFPELCSLPEKKGGGYLAKQYPQRVKYIQVRDDAELFDVDTTEDLERLKNGT